MMIAIRRRIFFFWTCNFRIEIINDISIINTKEALMRLSVLAAESPEILHPACRSTLQQANGTGGRLSAGQRDFFLPARTS